MMYVTADKELSESRVENNILPMLHQSNMAGLLRSGDIGNKRKSGKTKQHLQWEGGGFLLPYGAQNAIKMRQNVVWCMLKDEQDGWPPVKDGDPDQLTSDRCSSYWEIRKILRGSTPLYKHNSMIERAYLRGDQRKYIVRCIKCSFPQELRWNGQNKKQDFDYGITWDLLDGGMLDIDSVRYICRECGHPHQEYDKEKLFSPNNGAVWKPTTVSKEPFVRSYHLPALYSPVGFQPWYKSVALYLEAYDPVEKVVRDMNKYQVFYNNVLAKSFEIKGSKVTYEAVSFHRRTVYQFGQVPNKYATEYSGSKVLFVTCQVDVHKHNLAVATMGWTREARCYLLDYWRFEDDSENGCESEDSSVWDRLREIIEELVYVADDGTEYQILLVLIDTSPYNSVVVTFCSGFEAGVYPIMGRSAGNRPRKITEFKEFTTTAGTIGYNINVDYYKDRLAPVLRREWIEESGLQGPYHFNAPIDATKKQLLELTRETRDTKTDERGQVTSVWNRPGNAPNELWDLLGYGHAAVEIYAWYVCVKHYGLDKTDFKQFWDFMEGK
jgi:phage terminase large subunit GpA-like protein